MVDGYPVIIPVNYAMDAGIIVIRSMLGTKLSEADHANVTFQIDEIDQQTHTGWSVMVKGLFEELTAAHSQAIIERTLATGLEPWVPGTDGHWVRIIPHLISGRRIVAGEDTAWRLGVAAYM